MIDKRQRVKRMAERCDDINIGIYRRNYTPAQLQFSSFGSAYDRNMVRLRFHLLRRHVSGKRVLDIGCGAGSYLLPILHRVGCGYGLDVVPGFLRECKRRCPRSAANKLGLLEGRAEAIPLASSSVDCVYSFATLYYVPQLAAALREVSRVLARPGTAILEIGNLWSVNTYMALRQHRLAGWAKPYHVAYPEMKRLVREAGLEIREHRVFQLLPMYGGPRWLSPLVSTRWKRLAGIVVRGRMVDEWISSRRPARWLAFRHLLVCRTR